MTTQPITDAELEDWSRAQVRWEVAHERIRPLIAALRAARAENAALLPVLEAAERLKLHVIMRVDEDGEEIPDDRPLTGVDQDGWNEVEDAIAAARKLIPRPDSPVLG